MDALLKLLFISMLVNNFVLEVTFQHLMNFSRESFNCIEINIIHFVLCMDKINDKITALPSCNCFLFAFQWDQMQMLSDAEWMTYSRSFSLYMYLHQVFVLRKHRKIQSDSSKIHIRISMVKIFTKTEFVSEW